MEASIGTAKFVEGDFVVVVGDSIGNDGSTNRRMIISEVVAVGIEEVFLRCHKTNITFKRSIDSCYKIPKIKAKSKFKRSYSGKSKSTAGGRSSKSNI